LQPRDPLAGFIYAVLRSVVECEIDPQLTFSDEARVYLQGYINTQKNRYWSSQNPHETYEAPLQPVKMCAVGARTVGLVFLTNPLIAKDMYMPFPGSSFHI
jgi:hypothetical protein